MRVVLDANQFVSAVLFPVGHPAQILQAWRAGHFELAVSPSILEEIRRVLLYPRLQKKHAWTSRQVDDFLAEIVTAAILTPDGPEVRAVAADPTDDKYLACALGAAARYVVSGDEHLLRLGDYQGIHIVSAATFLSLIAS